MSIDLKKFCSVDECRKNLQNPFTRGGATWATNGHIMIRVPEISDISDVSDAPDIVTIFDNNFSQENLIPIPTIELPKVETNWYQCYECEGRGNVHDCPDCECECEECDGSGNIKTTSDDKTSVSINGVSFQRKYIRIIRELPEIRIQKNPTPEKPLSFIFNGGCGLLMSLRVTYPDNIVLIP